MLSGPTEMRTEDVTNAQIVGQLFGLDLVYAAVLIISRLNGMSSKFGWSQASATARFSISAVSTKPTTIRVDNEKERLRVMQEVAGSSPIAPSKFTDHFMERQCPRLLVSLRNLAIRTVA